MTRQTQPSGWPFAPFAVAFTLFVVGAGAIWYSLHRAALIDRASLHDRETAKEVELTGDILQAGRLPLPDFVKDLSTPLEKPSSEFVSPVGTAVMNGAPHVSVETAGRGVDLSRARLARGFGFGGGERRAIRHGVVPRHGSCTSDHLSMADPRPAWKGRPHVPAAADVRPPLSRGGLHNFREAPRTCGEARRRSSVTRRRIRQSRTH